MAGSELYISEMLEKFEEKMTKSMGSLAESMNAMADKMEILSSGMINSVEGIQELVRSEGAQVKEVFVTADMDSENYDVVQRIAEGRKMSKYQQSAGNYEMFSVLCNATGKVRVVYKAKFRKVLSLFR